MTNNKMIPERVRFGFDEKEACETSCKIINEINKINRKCGTKMNTDSMKRDAREQEQ